MKNRRNLIAAIAIAGTITGLGLGTTAASAAPASANISSAPIEPPVVVDPVALGDLVGQATKTAANREGFVKNVSYQAFFNAGQQQYNVVVMNLSQGHDPTQLNGIVGYTDAQYDGVTYGVWIFEDGTFVNEGDGGYINWAAYGLIDRVDDQTMVFTKH
jgi:hypothetical protein